MGSSSCLVKASGEREFTRSGTRQSFGGQPKVLATSATMGMNSSAARLKVEAVLLQQVLVIQNLFGRPGGLFMFTALVHGALLVYIMNRLLRSARPPTDQQVPFDDALKASRTTSQVYEQEIE